MAQARRDESAELCEWLTEAECERWTTGIVRPDGLGHWRDDGEAVEFFLEWDRGTETLGRLVAKVSGYERFEAERGASAWVIFAFVSPRRETAARAALAEATVPVATGRSLLRTPPRMGTAVGAAVIGRPVNTYRSLDLAVVTQSLEGGEPAVGHDGRVLEAEIGRLGRQLVLSRLANSAKVPLDVPYTSSPG